jgi:Ca2+-binding RTX toxin-like protein
MSNSDLILSSAIQPDAPIDGRSQKDWSVDWWKYIYSVPADDDHPILDQTGAKASTGQLPPVFYFVGTFNTSGEVTRNVQIAPNEGYKYLFMPLVNTQWDAVQLETFYPDYVPDDLTDVQVQGFTQALADTILTENGGSLFASIDGVAVGNLEAHRQTSDAFDYTLPENNLLGFSAGTITGSFADGFYLGIDLAALPPEEHTINFGGVFNQTNLDIPDELGLEDLQGLFQSFGQFSQNITYTISFDLNEIVGTNGKDTDAVRGTDGWDDISGLNGKDYIVALEGNDVLHGGNGADTLIGTNPNPNVLNPDVLNPGSGEIDILYGGNGPDTFVLGDAQNVYYTGNGLTDYALIKDFSTEDTIQLKGNISYELSENYSLGGTSGTSIFLAGNSELIGFVEGVTGLNLASNDFSFVS